MVVSVPLLATRWRTDLTKMVKLVSNSLPLVCPHFLLGAFAELRKATVSFVMSVRPLFRPSVRMEQLGSHSKDFLEILHASFFRKFARKIHVSLKSAKNNEYFTWRHFYINDNIRWILLRMRNISVKSWRENQNTPFVIFLILTQWHTTVGRTPLDERWPLAETSIQ
jgi:hypothetical protein